LSSLLDKTILHYHSETFFELRMQNMSIWRRKVMWYGQILRSVLVKHRETKVRLGWDHTVYIYHWKEYHQKHDRTNIFIVKKALFHLSSVIFSGTTTVASTNSTNAVTPSTSMYNSHFKSKILSNKIQKSFFYKICCCYILNLHFSCSGWLFINLAFPLPILIISNPHVEKVSHWKKQLHSVFWAYRRHKIIFWEI